MDLQLSVGLLWADVELTSAVHQPQARAEHFQVQHEDAELRYSVRMLSSSHLSMCLVYYTFWALFCCRLLFKKKKKKNLR